MISLPLHNTMKVLTEILCGSLSRKIQNGLGRGIASLCRWHSNWDEEAGREKPWEKHEEVEELACAKSLQRESAIASVCLWMKAAWKQGHAPQKRIRKVESREGLCAVKTNQINIIGSSYKGGVPTVLSLKISSWLVWRAWAGKRWGRRPWPTDNHNSGLMGEEGMVL